MLCQLTLKPPEFKALWAAGSQIHEKYKKKCVWTRFEPVILSWRTEKNLFASAFVAAATNMIYLLSVKTWILYRVVLC